MPSRNRNRGGLAMLYKTHFYRFGLHLSPRTASEYSPAITLAQITTVTDRIKRSQRYQDLQPWPAAVAAINQHIKEKIPANLHERYHFI